MYLGWPERVARLSLILTAVEALVNRRETIGERGGEYKNKYKQKRCLSARSNESVVLFVVGWTDGWWLGTLSSVNESMNL